MITLCCLCIYKWLQLFKCIHTYHNSTLQNQNKEDIDTTSRIQRLKGKNRRRWRFHDDDFLEEDAER